MLVTVLVQKKNILVPVLFRKNFGAGPNQKNFGPGPGKKKFWSLSRPGPAQKKKFGPGPGPGKKKIWSRSRPGPGPGPAGTGTTLPISN